MAKRRIGMGCLGVVLLLAVVIALAIGAAVVQGQRTPQGRPDQVALGSSFAAGAGLGRLQKGAPLLCARSVGGYPQRLARLRGLSIVDMSCGGAVTKHLLHGGQFFQGPQIRTITAETRLVTLTVGGNDVAYVGDLSMLAARKDRTPFGWLVRSLWQGPRTEAQRDWPGLERELTETLRAVRARAPRAVVVVATYPTLLPVSGTCARLGLSKAEVNLMRPVGDRLAAVTRAAAQKAGAVVVDMHRLGAAHDPCSAAPWTHGWKEAGPAPFHPTAAGAEATARAVSDALDRRGGGPAA